MSKENFTGDKKAPMKSLLADPEHKFIKWLTPKFPAWIEGYHLTLLTIPWSGGLILFGFLARNNPHWLWLSSLMLFLQWFTDCFDGALGRSRDTGIPKWGFYMDHFLDFVFMCSVFIGWTFLFGGVNNLLVWFMVLGMGCLMVNSFLAFGATGEFKITYLRIGPTELRLAFILINCLIIFINIDLLNKAVPLVFTAFIAGICVVVFRTQKYIWKVDMQDKQNRTEKQEQP